MQHSTQVSWRDFDVDYVLVHWAGVAAHMAADFEVVPTGVARHLVEGLITDGRSSLLDNLLGLGGANNASNGGRDAAYARLVSDVGDAQSGRLVLYRKKADSGSRTPPSKLPPDKTQGATAPSSDRQKVLAKVANFDPFIKEASETYGIAADQIRAIIATESRGKPDATSGAAFGLMQVTKDTWKGICAIRPELKKYPFDRCWTDPHANILVGTAVFQAKLKAIGVAHDDPDFARLAIVAYNAGEGTVKRAIKHATDGKSEHPTADCLKPEHLKPAIRETKIYSFYLTGNGKKNNKSGTVEEAIELKYKEISHYPKIVQGYLDELRGAKNGTPAKDDGATLKKDPAKEPDKEPEKGEVDPSLVTTVATVAVTPGAGGIAQPGDVIDGFVIYPKEVRTGGTLAWRNNNPGNIRNGKFAEAHGAFKGKKNRGFAIFPDHDTGFAAIVALLKTDTYRPLTVVQAMQKYAPATDNNDPAAYAANVSKMTGLVASRTLGGMSDAELKKFAAAIERVEGWKAGKIHSRDDATLPVTVRNALGAASSTPATNTNATGTQEHGAGGDFDWGQLAAWIALNEGRKNKVYLDTKGHPTIGIGFNLDREGARAQLKGLGLDYDAVRAGRVTLTEGQIDALFHADVSGAVMSARATIGPEAFDRLNGARKIVVIDLVFNLGTAGFAAFKKTIAAIQNQNFGVAADEMTDSHWYGQTGNRAKRDVEAMRTGVLAGITPSAPIKSTTITPPVVAPVQTGGVTQPAKSLAPVPAADIPPAGYSYHSLEKDATYGKEFQYEWEAGDYIDAAKKKRWLKIKTPHWVENYIVSFKIPDLPVLKTLQMHKRIAPQFRAFFLAAARRGLGDRILTNDGTFVPRTITGNEKARSNHALGSAIDINAAQNGWGVVPAARGAKGCVRELADFCADFGLYWGGWYSGNTKKDGMHFEAVKILEGAALRAACEKHGLDYDVVIAGGSLSQMGPVSGTTSPVTQPKTTTVVAATTTPATTTTTTPTLPATLPTYQEISRDFSAKITGSSHFTWHEALWLPSDRRHASATEVTPTIIKNIVRQAQALDVVRDYFGQPISVHCWLRPPEYNAKIGGAKNSAHLRGAATDFHMSVYTAQQVRQVLVHDKSLYPGAGELDVSWVHLDLEHNQWFWPKGGLLTDLSKVPKPDFPLPKKTTVVAVTKPAVQNPPPKPASNSTTTQNPPAVTTPPQIGADPPWVTFARGELGQAEIKGAEDNKHIVEYHSTTSLKATDDETAWCSSFVNWCMKKAGIQGTNSAAAASWCEWGISVEPRLGAVVVVYDASSANSSLTTSGNHVAFLMEETATHYKLLGGNQGDQVSLIGFRKEKWKLKACRWPSGVPTKPATSPATSQTTPAQVQQKLPTAQEVISKYVAWYNTDEVGLAEAIFSRGGDAAFVAAVFHILNQQYSSDADDVALEYVNRVKARGGGPRDALKKDAGLREFLIQVLGEGWTSLEEVAAIAYLRSLGPAPATTPVTTGAANSGASYPKPTGAHYAVVDSQAFLRTDPPNLKRTTQVIPAGTIVDIVEEKRVDKSVFVKLKKAENGVLIGWTSKGNLGSDKEIDPSLRPKVLLDVSQLTGDDQVMAGIHNLKGWFLKEQAARLGVDAASLAAVLKVESHGNGFALDGRMIIRFENHVFWGKWGKNHPDTFKKHFKYNADEGWKGHQWRKSDAAGWVDCHQGQDQEWEILNFAMSLDKEAAIKSASYGCGQVMGFNYETGGFTSPVDMFNQMNAALRPQLMCMVGFIANNSTCLSGLKSKDYVKFATGYNGSGQAATYGALIKSAAEAYARVTKGVTVEPMGNVPVTPPKTQTTPPKTTPPKTQTTPPATGGGTLATLMAKARLSPEEIAKARGFIAQLPQAQQRTYWLQLQDKVEYQNQRDNRSADEDKFGGTCNLTSLAMCLEYLGISNPNPSLQYDEALVKIAHDNNYGDITYATTWEKVAKHCGAKMFSIVSGDQKVPRATWEKKVRDEHLAVGHSVLCSIVGHIVRVQAIDEHGVVVDNPYGLETISAGTGHTWIRTNKGRDGWGAGNKWNEGEDNRWPWSDVEVHTFRCILAFYK